MKDESQSTRVTSEREAGEATNRSASPWVVTTFLRHQAGAIFVTVLDFATMSALVTWLHASPVLATVVGAATGGVTNFVLGRHWIFDASHANARGQAFRYAVVSGASLLLNAFGEYLLVDRIGLQYQLARAAVAALVSVAWNFPMQRYFVFAEVPSDHPRAASA